MDSFLRLHSGWNRFALGLRSRLRWGRDYRETGGDLEGSEFEVLRRFGFEDLAVKLSRSSALLNASKLDQLERLMEGVCAASLPGSLRVLDVGSQHFVYAPALSRFFSLWNSQEPRRVHLSGIEIDPFRRYLHGRTRRDLAAYYASLVLPAEYLVGDFSVFPFTERFHAVTLFRPFLDPVPLVKAGLPLSCLRPQEHFARALALLEPGGMLLLSYQSEAEAQLAQGILAVLGRAPHPVLRWDPPRGAVEKRPQWLQRVCAS